MEIPVLEKLTADGPGKSDVKAAPGKWSKVLQKMNKDRPGPGADGMSTHAYQWRLQYL